MVTPQSTRHRNPNGDVIGDPQYEQNIHENIEINLEELTHYPGTRRSERHTVSETPKRFR